jgi:hypothetical protein
VPLAPAVTVINAALLVAVHEQVPGAVTLTVEVPPALLVVMVVADRLNEHELGVLNVSTFENPLVSVEPAARARQKYVVLGVRLCGTGQPVVLPP